MGTIHALVAAARQRLREAGIPDAEADFDARLLAERLLGWDATRYLTYADQAPPPGFADRYHALIQRRAEREPVAYISGVQEFWGLSFEVSPAVLIPRPETELIVEIFLERWPDRDHVLRVADVCTGSGCLAVAIATERPQVEIVAVDISTDALTIARRNAERHGVSGRIRWVRTDVLQHVPGPFDAIVSNPPYVPAVEAETLQPEVIEHEPRLALVAGSDGLGVIRRLLAHAATRLRMGGGLIFEFGFGQAQAVRQLIVQTAGLELLEIRRDLQSIPRTAVVQRRG